MTSAAAADPGSLLAVYGTLRQPQTRSELGLADALEELGPCTIGGVLLDLGSYPGLVDGDGQVRGALLTLTRAGVLEALDRYERYVAAAPAASLFVRQPRRLLAPAVSAWVYRYQGDRTHARLLPGGDWLAR